MQERQYNFRTGRSAILRLLMMLSEKYANIQNVECGTLFLFDFQRRFLIRHDIVLKKKQNLDLFAKFCKLLESCNRYMRVQTDDALSESIKVETVVAQGSFLGLFFFVLFMDDLPNDIVYFLS